MIILGIIQMAQKETIQYYIKNQSIQKSIHD